MMKKSIPAILVISYAAFGVVLLIQMAMPPKPYVIHQSSQYAIININDDELADAFLNKGIRIEGRSPNSKTLVRVNTGNPSRIYKKLESNGSVYVINPNGVIVGENAEVELVEQESFSTFERQVPRSQGQMQDLQSAAGIKANGSSYELISHGNVYVLGIKKGGSVQAK